MGAPLVAGDPEALIQEARRRTRVRRARRLLVGVVVGGLGVLGYVVSSSGGAAVIAESSSHPFVNISAFDDRGELAFVSRGLLWVLDGRAGQLRAVSAAGEQAASPEFSPNRRWLSYTLTDERTGAAWVWVARWDGTRPRPVARTGGELDGAWLPSGELLAAGALWRIDRAGRVRRIAAAPAGLIAWSARGGRYVFQITRRSEQYPTVGALGVAVASSLTGPRRTWLRAPAPSRTQGGTLFIKDALVLPGTGAIILRAQTYCCDWADGFDIDEIRAPGARLVRLGTNADGVISVAQDGALAFTDGLNRYAWLTKRAVICSSASETCTDLRTARGVLSLDPAMSPDGRTVAFVKARGDFQSEIGQDPTEAWYRTHTLWLTHPGRAAPVEVPGSRGASTPVFSADGLRLLYVAGDALWLLPSSSSTPVKIAAPLFDLGNWNSFYGEVDWTSQFAWSQA